MMKDTISRIEDRMRECGIDVLYSRKVSDIRWMTGFQEVFDGEPAHMAALGFGSCMIHTDSRYSTAMRDRAAGTPWKIDDERISHCLAFAKFLEGLGRSETIRICIDPDLPLNEYRALEETLSKSSVNYKVVSDQTPLLSPRAIKSESEIDLLRKAQSIAEAAFDEVLGWIAPGVTELAVSNELEYRMKAHGAQAAAFSTIVASGPNSANPHSIAGQRMLSDGDLVVIDFGACYMDYRSDMTRTIAIGKPCDELRRIYDLTLEAHEACKAAIKPGVEGKEIHMLAAKIIADGGYPNGFTHGLGHGVGVDVHEAPTLNSINPNILQVGNVVTVEPGIYVPKLGGVRIEDFGVVAEGGFVDFATTPRDLVVI